jgi:Putative beta barrel porin-7 (BBP7)
MRKGFLGSLAVLTAGAGLTFGQQFNPAPGPLPGTLPPQGETTGYPPPGVAPGAYAGPSGAGAGYQYASPDNRPITMPPGMEGMVPPGSMGAGAPGGVYDEGQGGQRRGVLAGLFGGPRRTSFYFGADYLLWASKSMPVGYPLATTSSPADFGVAGGPSTVALVGGGDKNISFDMTDGIRGWAGWNWEGSSNFGTEISGFWMSKRNQQNLFPGNSAGLPVLAVPFYDVNAGAAGSYIVSYPGVNAGSIRIAAETRSLSGELNAFYRMYPSEEGPGGLTVFAGVRFFQLEEKFGYVTNSQTFGVPPGGIAPPGIVPAPIGGSSFFPGGGGVFAGTFFGPALAPYTVTTSDGIRTYNDFFGANFGFRGEIGYGNWFVQMTGKFGVGYMREWVDVTGYSSLTTSTNLVSTQAGGLFNLPQDLGRHHKDRLAILPEGNINIGYQLTNWMKVTAGYTFLYANTVVRPTTSSTPVLNPSLIPVSPTYSGLPGTFIPRDVLKSTDFHLQGFNAGLQISF